MRSTDSLSAESVARRFWMLIVIILLVTVLASAIAVRFFALPFFRDYQQNAIEAQAQKSAAQLAAELEHNEIIMSMIASDPNLVNIALGYDQNPSYLPDFLRALKLPKELSWVTFYDVFNDRISNFDVRAWSGPISTQESWKPCCRRCTKPLLPPANLSCSKHGAAWPIWFWRHRCCTKVSWKALCLAHTGLIPMRFFGPTKWQSRPASSPLTG